MVKVFLVASATALALASMSYAQSASDLREWCERATQTGDQDERLEMGQALLGQRLILGGDDVSFAESCINDLTGQEYRYEKGQMGFIPNAEFEALEAERAASAQQAADKEAEEAASQEAVMTLINRVEAERRLKVREALSTACNRLYSRSPDEAVLNPLCYDFFFANGLPE